jgi:hypothetical protein
MNDFTALRGILAPGTSVYGYHRGDPVTAQVVESWDLVAGEANDPDADVVAGDLPEETPADRVVPRPDEGATRADWEAYAIANGMSPEDATVASQEDLEAVTASDEVGEEQGKQPERPVDSAKKSEWQAYAKRLGADETWAYADTTTKADLQAYEPQPGDTVAVAATEANQG